MMEVLASLQPVARGFPAPSLRGLVSMRRLRLRLQTTSAFGVTRLLDYFFLARCPEVGVMHMRLPQDKGSGKMNPELC